MTSITKRITTHITTHITKRTTATVLAISGVWAATGTAQAAYVMTEVARPGAVLTQLWDINNSGQMVGYSLNGTAATDFTQAFVFDGTSYTALSGPAGSISSAALGISDSGRVVGSFASSTVIDPDTGTVFEGPSSGFIYQAGTYTTFNVPGAAQTVLRGISPNGRYITGYAIDADGLGVGFVHDTVLATTTTLSRPNSTFTIPQGVDDNGNVVGGDILSGPPTTRPGFTYDPVTGVRTDFNVVGAFRTAIRAITDDGTESGWFYDAGRVQHGFVGSTSSFEQIDFAGADGTYVEGNNNARWLVGGYTVGDTTHAFLAMTVPEPGTAALLALGLLLQAGALALRKRG
jgi:hypothetical protein